MVKYKNPYNWENKMTHLLNKRTSMGAHGRFNIWNLQQTQLLTGNLEAKVCTVSDSALDSKTQYISINAYSTINILRSS